MLLKAVFQKCLVIFKYRRVVLQIIVRVFRVAAQLHLVIEHRVGGGCLVGREKHKELVEYFGRGVHTVTRIVGDGLLFGFGQLGLLPPLAVFLNRHDVSGGIACVYTIAGAIFCNDTAGTDNDIVANGHASCNDGVHTDENVVADRNVAAGTKNAACRCGVTFQNGPGIIVG